jgi:tetratricopeptide (TPR) repeat protein
MKTHVYLPIIILSLTAGCGTSPVKTTSNDAPKNYSRTVSSVAVEHVQASQCPKTPKAVESYAKTDWKEMIQIANACVKAQKWAQVETLAEALSQAEPKAPWGAYYWALSADQRGDTARALWMTDLALKKAPDLGMLYFEKGRLLWSEKSYGPAMEALLKAVQLDGSLSEAHVFLGQIYFRDQDYTKATQHFYTVLQSRPNDPIALSGLAESRLQAGDTNGALEAIKRAVSAFPDKVEFSLREAYIFETVVGDKLQALQAYRVAKGVLTNKKMRGPAVLNVDKKIAELEKTTRQPSNVAEGNNKKPEVKR